MTQILFCLVAGVFLAISKLNADVCDNHLSLLEANFEPYNATVQVNEKSLAEKRVIGLGSKIL